jgi:hypothetical protein
MRIAVIGHRKILYDTALQLHAAGNQIFCFLTAKKAPEYTRIAADFRELVTDDEMFCVVPS